MKTIAISAITTDTGLITNDFVTSDTTLAVSGTLGAALSAGEFGANQYRRRHHLAEPVSKRLNLDLA